MLSIFNIGVFLISLWCLFTAAYFIMMPRYLEKQRLLTSADEDISKT